MIKPELTEEDKQRVADYLENNPLHSVERRPFNFWMLLFVLVCAVSAISVFSLMVAKYYF